MAQDIEMTTDTEIETDAGAETREAGKRMTIAAIMVTLIITAGRLLGALKGFFVAFYFGASGLADALNVLYDVVVFRSYANVEQLVRPAYLPVFVRTKAEDEEEAWRLTSVVTTTAFIVLSLAVAVGAVFAPDIIRAFWPKMAADPEVFPWAVKLFRLMAPAVVFFSLSILPELTLHSYKRFNWPAISDAIFRVMTPLAMVALIDRVWNRHDPAAIYAFGIGVLLGGTARFFIMVPALGRKLTMFRPSVAVTSPKAVETFALMLPVLAGVIFSALRGLVESRVATDLGEGAYSSLKYARNVTDLPIQILPMAVSFVVFPYLTEWAAQGAKDKLAGALVSMTRAMAFLFVPISVAFVLLAKPLVELLYLRGQFTTDDVYPTVLAFLCFAPGLIFFSVEGSINKWFFAFKDTVTPNVVGIGAVLIHIAIAVVGTYAMHGGLVAVALAYSVSKSLKVIVLYALIRRRIGAIPKAPVIAYIAKLAVSCAVMGAVILGSQMWALKHFGQEEAAFARGEPLVTQLADRPRLAGALKKVEKTQGVPTGLLVVTGADRKEVTVALDPTSQLYRGKKAGSPKNDLKAGRSVIVFYDRKIGVGPALAVCVVPSSTKMVLLLCVVAGTLAFLIAAGVTRIDEFYMVTNHVLGKVMKRFAH
jgi:putative peptidoglycan lipid II flippase